ncbi:MAG: molybdopterin synthase sulfur carrier subunit, partial [Actinobacteria bacterium]|nr:molybdopterin synthase sulfur carrier subunit [Actinomycetota bacterium]
MAIVNLRHPLRGLADEQDRVEIEGEDLVSVVRGLEARYPAMAGWILDEAG